MYGEHEDVAGKSRKLPAEKEVALKMVPEIARSMTKNSRKTWNVVAKFEPLLPPFMQGRKRHSLPNANKEEIKTPALISPSFSSQQRPTAFPGNVIAEESQAEVVPTVFTVLKSKGSSLLNVTEDITLDEQYVREENEEPGCSCVGRSCWDNGFYNVEFGAGWPRNRARTNEEAEIEEGTSRSTNPSLDEDSMEPFLSPSPFIPYDEMPQPRYLKGGPKNVNFSATELPRRPRSSVRQPRSEIFVLEASTAKLLGRIGKYDVRRDSSGSKDCVTIVPVNRMSGSSSCNDVDSIFLQVSLEEVTLTLVSNDEVTAIDDLFIIATVWSIMEPNVVNSDEVLAKRTMMSRVMILSKVKQSDSLECEERKFQVPRRASLIQHPSRIFKDLFVHRTLPWSLLCPSHEQGITRNYMVVRKLIDESVSRQPEVSYVPDLACVHFREVTTKSLVTRKPDEEDADRRKLDLELVDELLLKSMNLA